MQTLKIIKISEGVFKHILVEESGIEHAFFNTKTTKLSIDLGTFLLLSGNRERSFINSQIKVYDVDGVTQITTATLDDLVDVLADLKYPPLLDIQSNGGGSGGGTSSDRELVVTTYSVKTAFTGASIGDTITATQVIDVTGAPTTVSTIWRNQSTGADLASAPSAANLTLLGSQALTDAQLRAAAVVISNQNLQNIDTDLGAIADAAATTDTGSFSLISLFKRGLQNWTTLLSRIPTLDSSKTPVIPSMTNGGNLSVTTNATGTTFNAFASQACKQLNISNQTGTTIEVQQGGSGVALQIPSGAFYTFFGITNANQLAIRRTDTSNTQVTVTARWEV